MTTHNAVAAALIRGLFARRHGARPMTKIEERAVEIAAALGCRPGKRGAWLVRSQSSADEYRVTGDSCSCPFEGRCACKHAVAVELFCELAEELPRRLGEDRAGAPDETPDMLARYTALVAAARGYRPPPEGLLTAFRLEAVGDDAWRQQRAARRAGREYVPTSVRDLRPDRPWVAHLTGIDPRYEFVRAFLTGDVDYRDANKRGDRGVYLYFRLPPGLYEVYERLDHYKSRRYFARVADLALTEIPKTEVLECLCRPIAAS